MIKKLLSLYVQFRQIRKLGISTLFWFRYKDKNVVGDFVIKLFGKPFYFSNPYWFFHNLIEIFIEKVYLFQSDESLKSNGCIIDCGANFGLSLLFYDKFFPNYIVYAFEPDPFIFPLLKKNVENFQLKNVRLFNSAVWSSNIRLEFIQDFSLGGKILINESEFHNDSLLVNAINLQEFIQDKSVLFLKIDIEGSELEVFKSLENSLNNVHHLFIEYHSFSNQKQELDVLLNILTKAGFRYYIKEAYTLMKFPFVSFKPNYGFDLQLNIFGYRS